MMSPSVGSRFYQKEKEAELSTALGGDPSPQQQWLITDTVRHPHES